MFNPLSRKSGTINNLFCNSGYKKQGPQSACNTRIKKILIKMKAPACLINKPEDLFYLTGLKVEGFWLLLTPNSSYVFAPELLAEQLKASLPGIDVITDTNLIKLLISFCKKKKIKKIGIDEDFISFSFAKKLQNSLKIQNINTLISESRQIKDDCELRTIKRACKIASQAMKYAKKSIYPGTTETKIAFKIESYFTQMGVKCSFPIIVASGPNSAYPHHTNSDRKIAENDVILIDLGCIYNGYCSDLTRTFFLGKINKLKNRVYNLVKKAQAKAIKSVKGGVRARSIDRIARQTIECSGYKKEFNHSTGHGVGVSVHEPPSINKSNNAVLKAGMVITVEPGVYIPGCFGVRIEDTVVVTKNGCEVLTR